MTRRLPEVATDADVLRRMLQADEPLRIAVVREGRGYAARVGGGAFPVSYRGPTVAAALYALANAVEEAERQ